MTPFANPDFISLARRQSSSSLRKFFYLGFVLGILGLILCVEILEEMPINGFILLLLTTSWLTIIVSPLIIAYISIATIARDINSQAYELIYVTDLKGSVLIRGYLVVILYRVRILIILLMGSMPLLVLGIMRGNLVARVDCTTDWDFFEACRNIILPSQKEWAGWALLSLEAIISLWGLNVFAASIGVITAHLFRSKLVSIITTLVSVILLLFIVLIMFHMTLPPPLNTIYPFDDTKETYIISTLVMIVPYILSIGIISSAKNTIRQRFPLQ